MLNLFHNDFAINTNQLLSPLLYYTSRVEQTILILRLSLKTICVTG